MRGGHSGKCRNGARSSGKVSVTSLRATLVGTSNNIRVAPKSEDVRLEKNGKKGVPGQAYLVRAVEKRGKPSPNKKSGAWVPRCQGGGKVSLLLPRVETDPFHIGLEQGHV